MGELHSNASGAYELHKHFVSSEAVREKFFITDPELYEIDYTINEDLPVYDAVQKFAAYNIGCLVTVNADGKISGVVSERDYVCKIALLGKTSKDTTVKEISTKSANLITASPSETVSDCMAKMLLKDIRHLPLLDESGGVVGIVSIKDLVKAELKEKEEAIRTLSNFALGKGGHFGSE